MIEAPLRMAPVMLTKIWAPERMGGGWSQRLGAGPGVGEVWLASSVVHPTRVAEGPGKGLGLDELTRRHPAQLTGTASAQHYPLLLKVLAVGQWLSVQVHPDEQTAAALEGAPTGKSEAWYILEAAPGAEIIHGFARQVSPEQLRKALEKKKMVQLLARVQVRPGQLLHIPPGTVHSLGPGLVVFEIQQPTDITYRFYDWDRLGPDGRPRQLHLQKALQALKPSGAGTPIKPRPMAEGVWGKCELLVEDPHYSLIKWSVGRPAALGEFVGARALFVVQGRGRLVYNGRDAELAEGQCWVLPVGVEWEISPGEGEMVVLEARGPRAG